MDNLRDLPYLPGKAGIIAGPLARYLPPIPAGIIQEWMKSQLPPGGGLILDPFGASPQAILEAARAGYRLIVASNNPVASFMLETLASAPRGEDFRAALADFAAIRKGEERLELHIQALYAVECSNCHRLIQVKAFIWERKSLAPEACLVECPHCGDSGERPVTPASQERLTILARANLHRSRALERVAAIDDPIRSHVDQALNYYLPRPLYALMTMINRLEGLASSPERQRLLAALLLSVCDEGNTLWPFPAARHRPRQLIQPPIFRENNLWLALENAIEQWQATDRPVQVTTWPELPSEQGGICLFHGRFKDLAAGLSSVPLQGVLAVMPRPNQAFWTLSALWAGWLWGREAVGPLRSVLPRQRYDWQWLASALEAALSSLAPTLKSGTPILGLLAEAEPSYLSAVLAAADSSHLELTSIALRPGSGLELVGWEPVLSSAKAEEEPEADPDDMVRKAMQNHLTARAEPAPYSVLHAVAISALAKGHVFSRHPSQPIQVVLNHLQIALQRNFSNRSLLTHFGGSQHSPETGLWWLQAPLTPSQSLADRTEMEVVRYLQHHPDCSREEIDEAVCNAIPGLLTPPLDLVLACLESYGEEYPPQSNLWRLLPGDSPQERRSELKVMQQLLEGLGQKLGYTVTGENPLNWIDETGQVIYQFCPVASTIIGRFIFDQQLNPRRSFIVLPGSRANLVSFKLKRDPWLNQVVSAGWRFLKFRHLRLLASSLLITRETWEDQVNADPIEYKPTQIEMF